MSGLIFQSTKKMEKMGNEKREIYIYKLIDRNKKEFFDINLHLLRYLSS